MSFPLKVIVVVVILLLSAAVNTANASCSFSFPQAGPRRVYPELFRSARRDFVRAQDVDFDSQELRDSAPKLYAVSGCGLRDEEKKYKERLSPSALQDRLRTGRSCSERSLITSIAKFERVSYRVNESGSSLDSSHEHPRRSSLRAEWDAVDVDWPLLDAAVKKVQTMLWPSDDDNNGDFELKAELQTVLSYTTEKDGFGAHRDRCQVTNQEAVLVLDLGLRDSYPRDDDDDADGGSSNRSELFFHGLPDAARADPGISYVTYGDRHEVLSADTSSAPYPKPFAEITDDHGPFAGNWTARFPGDFVAFPMHRIHGVGDLAKLSRTVAVFHLYFPCRCGPLCPGNDEERPPVTSCSEVGRCVNDLFCTVTT